jgi:hypothetical protein
MVEGVAVMAALLEDGNTNAAVLELLPLAVAVAADEEWREREL